MILSNAEEVPALFEKVAVKDVQEYERKTRAEIEKRKEDLRVMVGERYRDLIEAADTIREMKSSVESVSQHVKKMYDFNATINQRKKVSPELNRAQSSPIIHQQCYSIAAQVKLLLDIPDKIWLNLENRNHLNAAKLYLLAQHVHTSLEFEMHHKSAVPISTCFPVIDRQWATILHFRSSILQKCQEAMKAMGSSNQQMADCVGAILCITDCMPRKLCSDFLSTRMASLEDVLNPNNHESNVKDQIAALIKLIKETVCLTCSLFHRGRNVNKTSKGRSLLTEVLETVTNAKKDDFLSLAVPDTTPWAEHLPQSFSDFCPTLQATGNALSDDFLQETFSHWIKVAKDTVTSGVTHILSYVNSVKGLASIQEAIQETLHEINQDDGWTGSCRRLISKEINLWEEFLSSLFVFRIKTIVHSQVHGIVQLSKQNIKSAVEELKTDGPEELEKDVSGFIWLEEIGDLPAKFVWSSAKSDGNAIGKLTLKAKGFTPRVQNVCNVMDNRLKAVLEDVGCYTKSSQAFAQKLSLNMSLDLTHIQSDVQSACDNLVNSLLEFIRETLGSTSEECVSTHGTVTKALMLARLCAALRELCPHLQKGIAGGFNSSLKELFKDPHSSGKLLKYGEDPLWQSIKAKLLDEKLRLYGFWKSDLCRRSKGKTETLVPVNVAHMFKHMPHWDLIEIDEENEHGVAVKSTISVPMQASWQMQSMIYWICGEINKDGGHVIPRPTLQELHVELLTMVLTVYEEYLKNIREKKQFVSQSSSLQLLFDVQFLTGLIAPKENKELGDRIQAICTDFESHVDPFDLDVFSPYFNNHLKRCIQRSVVLLGFLTSTDRTGIYGSSRPTYLSQQEQHNVLNLSLGSRTRFTLLPVGTSASKNTSEKKAGFQPKAADTKLPSVVSKPDKSRSISPQRSAVVQSTGVHKSASSSFFGAMSSSWFGN